MKGSLRRVSFQYGRTFVVEPELGAIQFTLAARDLKVFNGEPSYGVRAELEGASAVFRLRCEGPIEISEFQGSRNVLFFDEMRLKEGVGVHAYAALDATGIAVLGKARLSVKEPVGVMELRAGGGLLTNRVSGGVARITVPGASETWLHRPGQLLVECAVLMTCQPSDFERRYEKGPGTYEVELTYTSLETMGVFWGVVLGLAPVADVGRV